MTTNQPPPKRTRSYGHTDHAVARRAAEKGWQPFKNRSDFENSLRFHGRMELPKK